MAWPARWPNGYPGSSTQAEVVDNEPGINAAIGAQAVVSTPPPMADFIIGRLPTDNGRPKSRRAQCRGTPPFFGLRRPPPRLPAAARHPPHPIAGAGGTTP